MNPHRPGLDEARQDAPTVIPRMAPVTIPDYELLRRIGGGSYGEVWLARSTATGALRAVKIVWRHTFEEERPFEREFEGIQWFERISREHSSQLALFHVGRNDAKGCFYYVMEAGDDAAAGSGQVGNWESMSKGTSPSHFPACSFDSYTPKTLRSEIQRHGRLPAARVLELGLALTEALMHLHKHGLVHRDIKPSNIIFVNGRAKLADIGLVTGAARGDDSRSIVGTEGYLAPEGPGLPQADLFALGKVLYEALTGLDRHQFPELPADLRQWSDATLALELNAVLVKSCAADARDRYETAEKMRADLGKLAEGKSVRLQRRFARRFAFGQRFGLAAASAAVLVLMVAMSSKWLIWREPPARRNQLHGPPSRAESPSVAVLPFVDESPDPADEYLADSYTDELIHSLSRSAGLKVAARNSSFTFKGSTANVGIIGKRLGVSAIVQGSVRRSAEQVVVAARLVNISDGFCLWSKTYTGELKDIFAIQQDMRRQIVTVLNPQFDIRRATSAEDKGTKNFEAWRLYQLGRFHLNKRSEESIHRAIEYFQQAIDLDASYARAHAGFGDGHSFLVFYGRSRPKVAFPKAKSAVERALELDESLCEAHASLGQIKAYYEWDWPGAERQFRRAIELSPDDVPARCWYGLFLVRIGRGEEGMRHIRLAQSLDPLALGGYLHAVWALGYLGRRDQLIIECRKAIEIDPNSAVAHGNLGLALLDSGEVEEAFVEFRKCWNLRGIDPAEIEAMEKAHRTDGISGFRRRSVELLLKKAEEGRSLAVEIAGNYMKLREFDQAIHWLEKGCANREPQIIGIGVLTDFEGLRSAPRFQAILGEIGLPQNPGEQILFNSPIPR